MRTVIHWFRRDLRISDNTALSKAVARAQVVLPVFIVEDALKTGPDVGAARLGFLLRAAESLQRNLEALGYSLIVRHGRSEVELPKLCLQAKAEAVFCNRRYEPYSQARDTRVFNALNAIGVGFELFKDAVAWDEREILTQAGNPFTVFTPYAKAWRNRKPARPAPALSPNRTTAPDVPSDGIPDDPAQLGHPLLQPLPPAGEKVGQDVLKRFMAGPVLAYGERRDFPAQDLTSHLSAHLRCGTVGIRTILTKLAQVRRDAAPEHQKSCDVFLNELIWREFYLQILANYPHVMKGSFRRQYDALAWSQDQGHFQAWCEGQTGYPIVDAAMRCLNATGWMHNRLRMITAMFLTKDLMINWHQGERYFMHQLIDGDLAANNGGWQWSAGTGTDAAPYFRIFNPVTQAQRFDPEGAFVRQWVPELAHLPNDLVHQPWKTPLAMTQSAYPERIVLHEVQRDKCLRMYKRVVGQPAAKPAAKLDAGQR